MLKALLLQYNKEPEIINVTNTSNIFNKLSSYIGIENDCELGILPNGYGYIYDDIFTSYHEDAYLETHINKYASLLEQTNEYSNIIVCKYRLNDDVVIFDSLSDTDITALLKELGI